MQSSIHHKYHLTLLMMVLVSFWWQCCCAYRLAATARISEHHNPNMRCAGKNEKTIWPACKYGGYIENPDPKNCADRYVCYVGVNETCHRGDRCADNAICTACGLCQKCDSAENCSEFELCPSMYAYNAINYIKRGMENKDD